MLLEKDLNRQNKKWSRRVWASLGLMLLAMLVVDVEPPRWGMVNDEKTGEPLVNALVTRHLTMVSANPAGGSRRWLMQDEVQTNARGEFRFPLRLHLHFPILSGVEASYAFHKAGYFPIDTAFKIDTPTVLKKKVFAQDFGILDSSDRSNMYQLAFDHSPLEVGQTDLHKAYKREDAYMAKTASKGLAGQFYRQKGARFSKLCMIMYHDEFFTFEENSKAWLKINNQGEVTEGRSTSLPVCDKIISPIHVDKILRFYMDGQIGLSFYPFSNPHHNFTNPKSFLTFPISHQSLVAISADDNCILSIEEEGRLLCEYKETGFRPTVIKLGRTWSPRELLGNETSEDKTLIFRHTQPTIQGHDLLVQFGENWRVYRVSLPSDGKVQVQKKGEFSAKGPFSVIHFAFDALYLAQAGKPVRRFVIPGYSSNQNQEINEDLAFSAKIKQSGIGDITDMAGGYSRHISCLYMLENTETIYRFGITGLPDHKLNVSSVPDSFIPNTPDTPITIPQPLENPNRPQSVETTQKR
jgi:hypothetical protein